MATKKFIDYCFAVMNTNDEIDKRVYNNKAFAEMFELSNTLYGVTENGVLPMVNYINGEAHVILYVEKDVATAMAKATESGSVFILPGGVDGMLSIYKTNVSKLLVQLDFDNMVALNVNNTLIHTKCDTGLLRPKLTGLFLKLSHLSNKDATEEEMAQVSNEMCIELGRGKLFILKNRETHALFVNKDNEIPIFSDREFVDISFAKEEAEKRWNWRNVEIIPYELEGVAIPPRKLLFNDRFVIPEEAVKIALMQTEAIDRALEYIKRANERSGYELDGEDLLMRLMDYPDMYKEFILNISDDYEFTGKITASAEGYSGAVLMQTTTGGNAAAAYSLIEKFKRDPGVYLKLFKTGQIQY